MVKFDSNRYWQKTTWDRYSELGKVPKEVRDEFIYQECLFVSCIQKIACNRKIRVLDLACGTGRIAESVKKSNPESIKLFLADFNHRTLTQAKENLKKYSDIEYILLDAYKVGDNFQNEFDVILCADFLHHISRPDILIKQISIALKPGGIFVANVFNQNTYNKWDRIKYGYIHSFCRWLAFNIFTKLYAHSPNSIKTFVDKMGLARISPLRESEILHLTSSYFKIVKLEKSYYIWFCAQKSVTN